MKGGVIVKERKILYTLYVTQKGYDGCGYWIETFDELLDEVYYYLTEGKEQGWEIERIAHKKKGFLLPTSHPYSFIISSEQMDEIISQSILKQSLPCSAVSQ